MGKIDYRIVLEDLKARKAELETELNRIAATVECIEIMLEQREPVKSKATRRRASPTEKAENGESITECPLCLGPQKKTAVCRSCDVTACKKCVKYGRCTNCRKRKAAA